MSFVFATLFACSLLLIFVFNDLSQPAHRSGLVIASTSSLNNPSITTIGTIPLPQGYERIQLSANSFGAWLRNIRLREDNTLHLFNGQPKTDQASHYAILDISIGKKDLQQCADAIMRLRGEYFFAQHAYDKIVFKSSAKTFHFLQEINNTIPGDRYNKFLSFMEKVFINCGTYTIDEMTTKINMKEMMPGDVFVKAGSPGHAMIVADVAINKLTGKKIYVIAQSFMPAQDIHIVINPGKASISPWYEVTEKENIATPGYTFSTAQLKRFR